MVRNTRITELKSQIIFTEKELSKSEKEIINKRLDCGKKEHTIKYYKVCLESTEASYAYSKFSLKTSLEYNQTQQENLTRLKAQLLEAERTATLAVVETQPPQPS